MNLQNYYQIIQELSEFEQRPRLVAVTKYSDMSEINEAIKAWVKIIGENRVESASEKFQWHSLSLGGRVREGVRSVEKHFIGTLQTKKLRKIIELFDVIESVGNIKQIEKVEFIANELQKPVRIFLQFNISKEEQKSGFEGSDIHEILEVAKNLKYTRIEWIMWMASQESDDEIRKQFRTAKEIFETLQKEIPSIQELSLGMSHDYKIALEEWATLVRIGSKLFQ